MFHALDLVNDCIVVGVFLANDRLSGELLDVCISCLVGIFLTIMTMPSDS